MKKNLVAVSVLGLCAATAQAQSSVTIYGLVDTGITYTNKVLNTTTSQSGSKFSVHPGAMQGSRLGFRGVEDLGGGMKALFVLENGFAVDTGTMLQGGLLFGRKSVVGLEG